MVGTSLKVGGAAALVAPSVVPPQEVARPSAASNATIPTRRFETKFYLRAKLNGRTFRYLPPRQAGRPMHIFHGRIKFANALCLGAPGWRWPAGIVGTSAAETATELVQGNGDVVILVSVDSQHDENLRRLSCGHPAIPLHRGPASW